jgi:hypothetical protein
MLGMTLPSYASFDIAFWHPFGPHGRESQNEIIERKRAEIVANDGWTLWSFQHRKMLHNWHYELLHAKRDKIYVFCSKSPKAVDPAREGTLSNTIDCQSYRFIEEGAQWKPMPEGIRIPHPFRPGKTRASAFVIQQVLYPIEPFDLPAVMWFSLKNGPWRETKIPTRGEYLIRAGGAVTMRSVTAVLELKAPYLAVVNADDVEKAQSQKLPS